MSLMHSHQMCYNYYLVLHDPFHAFFVVSYIYECLAEDTAYHLQ